MYDIELEKDTSTVESGLTWLITCFFATASPTVLLYSSVYFQIPCIQIYKILRLIMGKY